MGIVKRAQTRPDIDVGLKGKTMNIILAGEEIFRIDLIDLKFLTQVKGWSCVQGHHLYNFLMDELVTVSDTICRSGTEFNIKDFKQDDIFFKKSTRICPKDNCYCGYDIGLPKGETRGAINELITKFSRLSDVELEDLPIYAGQGNVRAFAREEFLKEEIIHIDWFLGKRCNFNCSYCSPTIHDSHSPMPSLTRLIEAHDFLLKTISSRETSYKNEIIHFLFHGGEPTIIPSYLDFLRHIKSSEMYRTKISTLTNFSRKIEYLLDLNKLSDVTFSVHLEYLSASMIDKVDKFLSLRDEHCRSVNIKFMYLREHREKIDAMLKVIKKHKNFFYMVTPLHNKIGKKLYDYDEVDKSYFQIRGEPGEGLFLALKG